MVKPGSLTGVWILMSSVLRNAGEGFVFSHWRATWLLWAACTSQNSVRSLVDYSKLIVSLFGPWEGLIHSLHQHNFWDATFILTWSFLFLPVFSLKGNDVVGGERRTDKLLCIYIKQKFLYCLKAFICVNMVKTFKYFYSILEYF